MNIESSSTAVATTGSATQTKSTSSKNNSSSTSFDEELKNTAKTESKDTEKTKETESKQEEKVQDKKEDKKEVQNNDKANVEIKGEISQTIDSEDVLTKNIQAILNTNREMALAQSQYKRLDIGNIEELSQTLSAKVDYTTINMDDKDVQFFTNLVQNTDLSMQSVAAEIKNLAEANVQQAQKTANVSATLMNALHEGIKTNQPFRIDFDKDISVIIKINKDGSIAANFIPGDKAVEEYLKMNISTLKQRFDEQELSYSDLTYSRSRKEQQEQENNKRKNKENGHE